MVKNSSNTAFAASGPGRNLALGRGEIPITMSWSSEAPSGIPVFFYGSHNSGPLLTFVLARGGILSWNSSYSESPKCGWIFRSVLRVSGGDNYAMTVGELQLSTTQLLLSNKMMVYHEP
ncbi:hypothetical protein M758_UG070800 [Ceratodon purpureus]|nr:hypothetical protein M758_UG070800 [Ceratodon purpureus]